MTLRFLLPAFSLLLLTACEQPLQQHALFSKTGDVEDVSLDEISGIQASALRENVYFVHNDDGDPRVSAIDEQGQDLGSFMLEGATNRDWEDIAALPGETPMLVIADSGDNFAQHDSVVLYFVEEPQADEQGRYSGTVTLTHTLKLRYPGGARDCESVAYDPVSDRIFLISKRDKPARIYAIDRALALSEDEVQLEQLGEVHTFRPPTAQDVVTFGQRDAPWVSQPTGLDFNEDGSLAAIISYRSVYLFSREGNENWEAAFARKPLEFEGPVSHKEEAITFSNSDPASIIVTTEGVPSPVYRFKQLED